jgi:hypothetical protein
LFVLKFTVLHFACSVCSLRFLFLIPLFRLSRVESKVEDANPEGDGFSLPQNVRTFVVETVGNRNERRESAKRKGTGIQSRARNPNTNSAPRMDMPGLSEAIDAA